MVRKQDQIRGCLLGSAAGDALGYCVDALSLPEIRERFGPEGIRGYDTLNGYAPFSCHTQMAMFTANGLLFGATRGALRGVMAPYVNYLEVFYRDWAKTQRYSLKKDEERPYAWLSSIPELHARRGGDTAMLYALERPQVGTMEEPVNRSKSPYGLTRCYPIGLFLNPKEIRREEIARLGGESAALTQGDPMGFLPAAFLAELVNRLLYDKTDSFRNHLHKTMVSVQRQYAGRFPQTGELLAGIAKAEVAAMEKQEAGSFLERLSPGDAPEVLAAACYVCLRFPGDFDRAVVAAVNHSGSSAAVGAVVGALLGVQLGTEGIPEFYLEPLELRNILEELADDLFQGCPLSRDANLFDDSWDQKYIQRSY